jgi:hypothetical protein
LKTEHAGHLARVVEYLGGDPSRVADRSQRRIRRAGRAQEAHLSALRRMAAADATPRRSS